MNGYWILNASDAQAVTVFQVPRFMKPQSFNSTPFAQKIAYITRDFQVSKNDYDRYIPHCNCCLSFAEVKTI